MLPFKKCDEVAFETGRVLTPDSWNKSFYQSSIVESCWMELIKSSPLGPFQFAGFSHRDLQKHLPANFIFSSLPVQEASTTVKTAVEKSQASILLCKLHVTISGKGDGDWKVGHPASLLPEHHYENSARTSWIVLYNGKCSVLMVMLRHAKHFDV